MHLQEAAGSNKKRHASNGTGSRRFWDKYNFIFLCIPGTMRSLFFGKTYFVNMQEINDLCNGCNGPGENIKQIQGRDRLKVGKYSVDPDNTEYTGSHDNDEHGNQTFA